MLIDLIIVVFEILLLFHKPVSLLFISQAECYPQEFRQKKSDKFPESCGFGWEYQVLSSNK